MPVVSMYTRLIKQGNALMEERKNNFIGCKELRPQNCHVSVCHVMERLPSSDRRVSMPSA